MQRVIAGVTAAYGAVRTAIGRSLRRWPYVWMASGAVLIGVAAWQLTYPSDTSLPFARLNGEAAGHASSDTLRQKLKTEYATMPLTVVIAGKSYKTTASEAGVRVNDTATIAGLTDYPTWQRFIPFSLLIRGALKNQRVIAELDKTRSLAYAKARSQDCAVAPKNAGVVVRGGKAELDAAKNGQACPVAQVQDALRQATLQKDGLTITLHPEAVKPDRSNKDVEQVLAQAQAMIDRHLVLSLAGTEQTVAKTAIAAWLVFPQDEKTKAIRVETDDAKVRAYLASVQSAVYIAPGVTKVYTTDGVETSRTVGNQGRGIDTAVTAAALRKQLVQGDGTVQATLAVLEPKVTYVRSYSPTQAGLQALVNDIAKDKGDYAISLRSMSGSFSASANESKQYHPASTYKMYVGWAIIKRIAAGQMQWSDTAINGKTVNQCFDAMIINSDNACGEWLGEQVGWKNLNAMLKGLGLACTNLGTAWYSCAADESLFLYKLQAGQLLPADQADRLISVMKKQVYRSGIPAGVGVPVADKVGFLEGKLHDAAIVYAPGGTYVLTIMTSGSSWGQIADAARQIQAQLTRMGF